MKPVFIISLILMSLVSFPSWGADLNKGFTAFDNEDYATALKELKPFADQGNALAQSYLGWMYEVGRGVPEDLSYFEFGCFEQRLHKALENIMA